MNHARTLLQSFWFYQGMSILIGLDICALPPRKCSIRSTAVMVKLGVLANASVRSPV